MQATFVKAYRALGQFRSGYPFGAWLFAIARSKLLDHFRAQRLAPPPLAHEPWDARDPAALLAERDGEQAIWRLAQRRLPSNQFDALWLMYKEEMSVKDIAAVMNKTQTHVKVLLFRARQALVRSLRHAGDRPALGRRGAALCPAAPVLGKPVG
jgi:RNA polymerase sigma-70 factor (ECF subfamily)